MHPSSGVVLGLASAWCWGSADFAARFTSRRVGAYRALFFMQFFGFISWRLSEVVRRIFAWRGAGLAALGVGGLGGIAERCGIAGALSFV